MKKVVSTKVIHCDRWGTKGTDAIEVTYDDGTVKVQCEGNCQPCSYVKGAV